MLQKWKRGHAESAVLLCLLLICCVSESRGQLCSRATASSCVISCRVAENEPADTVLSTNVGSVMGLNFTARTTTYNLNLEESVRGTLALNTSTGRLSVLGSIDYERISSGLISGLIVARQQGSGSLMTATSAPGAANVSCNLSVRVTDLNEAPRFLSSYSAQVFENSPVGTSVIQVSATDNDTTGVNANVTYILADTTNYPNLVPPQSTDETLGVLAFSVNARTGLLQVKNSSALDFERRNQYIIWVVAQDGGLLIAFARIPVTVLDANEIAPTITLLDPYLGFFPARHSLPEGEYPTGILLGYFEVFDPEQAPNSYNSLQVTVANDTAGIAITEFLLLGPRGPSVANIYTLRLANETTLDREVKSEYVITIVAEDRQLPQTLVAMLNFTLTITDVDDSSPIFASSFYSAGINENNIVTMPDPLVQVHAEDADFNDTVVYSIISVNNRTSLLPAPFRINAMSGDIFPAISFDHEATSVYQVIVRATSLRNTSRYDTAQVTITINDINDNPPVFTKTVYQFTVFEENEGSQFIGRVSASDADTVASRNVRYTLSGSNVGLFDISTTTGIIHTRQHTSLNREEQANYKFLVFAFDSGTPQLNSSAEVELTIKDRNDNGPRFMPDRSNVQVMSDVNQGITLLQLFVIDPDIASNSLVAFSLTSAPGSVHSNVTVHTYFTLSYSGSSYVNLTVSSSLRDLGNTSFSLTIRARDPTTTGNMEAAAAVDVVVVSFTPLPGSSSPSISTPIIIVIILVSVALLLFAITIIIVKVNLNRKKKVFEVQAQLERAPSVYKSRENVFDNPLAHGGSYKVRPDALPIDNDETDGGKKESPTTVDAGYSSGTFPETPALDTKPIGTPGSLREVAMSKGRSRNVVYSATASEIDLVLVGTAAAEAEKYGANWNRQASTRTNDTMLSSLATTPSSGSNSRTGSAYFATTESSDDTGSANLTRSHSQSEHSLSHTRPHSLLADYRRQKQHVPSDSSRQSSPRKTAPSMNGKLSPSKAEANRSLYASTPGSLSGRSTPNSLAGEDYGTWRRSPKRKPTLERHHSVAGERPSAKQPVNRRVSFNKYPEMQV